MSHRQRATKHVATQRARKKCVLCRKISTHYIFSQVHFFGDFFSDASPTQRSYLSHWCDCQGWYRFSRNAVAKIAEPRFASRLAKRRSLFPGYRKHFATAGLIMKVTFKYEYIAHRGCKMKFHCKLVYVTNSLRSTRRRRLVNTLPCN